MEKTKFDFEEFARQAGEQLRSGKPLTGKDGVFTPLLKRILEASLEGEMEVHLGQNKEKNRRNGRTGKNLKSSLGSFQVLTPRDRTGSFEPQTIPKRQTTLSSDIDKKIIGLYGLGVSYGDIRQHLEEMYGLSIEDATLTAITDRIIPEIKDWQNRPLESVYPVVWLDAMHYKVREDGVVKSKAVYSILAVNQDGQKDVIGIYFGDHESSSFWRQVLNDLKLRGVEDIFIACIDNLNGFAESIEGFFPNTEVQLCVVHQMRNSMKYVTYKDLKELVRDLKKVYNAPNEDMGLHCLEEAENKWGRKYPAVFKSWRLNWPRLSHFFKYPNEIRRLIYTTNPIESYHRMVRKTTKTKGAFTSENAILKQIYLATMNALTKWNGKIFGWNIIYNHLNIYFAERFKKT